MSRYKSDGTTRDDNGPIILRPVSIADAKGVLNENSNDLGTLCKSTKINPWSRRKPIRKTNIGELSESDFAIAKYGFDINHIYDMFPIIDISNIHATGNTVKSLLPYGTASSPYRLTDFDGYNHEAPALFSETTRHPKYNSSLSVYNWCYSANRDAENLKNSKSDSVNELIDEDGTNHLFYPQGGGKYHTFSYVYNGEQRYREIELKNVLNFNTLQNTVTNPNKIDPLSISEIFGNIDLSTSDFANYALGLILTINNVNYLYNTKLPVTALLTGSQVNESFVVSQYGSGLYNKIVLAEKTGQSLNIYIYPWLIATRNTTQLPTVTYDNVVVPIMTYQSAQSKLPSEGTTIKTRLCLCPRLQTDYTYSAYFKQITNSDANSLYSCELKTGSCCNRDVVYKKYSINPQSSPKITLTYLYPYQGPQYPPYAPTLWSTIKRSVSTSYTQYDSQGNRRWDVTGILKYISGIYMYAGYLVENYVQFNDEASDPYYGLSSGYKKYSKVSHTSSTSTLYDMWLDIKIETQIKSQISSKFFIEPGYTEITPTITNYTATYTCLTLPTNNTTPHLMLRTTLQSLPSITNYGEYTDMIGGTSIPQSQPTARYVSLNNNNIYAYNGSEYKLLSKWEIVTNLSGFNADDSYIKFYVNNNLILTTTLKGIFGTQS